MDQDRDERHGTRTPVEFIAHLLEVGQWYMSAIELDRHRPDFVDGERLREEAERIVGREIAEGGVDGRRGPEMLR